MKKSTSETEEKPPARLHGSALAEAMPDWIASPLARSFSTAASNLRFGYRRYLRGVGRPLMGLGAFLQVLALAVVSVVLAAVLLDEPVGLYRGSYPERVANIAEQLTTFGKSGWVLFPSAILLILLTFRHVDRLSRIGRFRLFRWNLLLCYIFVGVGLPSLVSTILKRIIGRPRPVHLTQTEPLTYQHFALDASYASFPSGHATTIGALAMVLAILFPAWRVAFLAMALVIGGTRIVVGAHYPSDVAAGLAFGAFSAWLIARLAGRSGLLFLHTCDIQPKLRPAHRLSRLFE